MDKHKHLRYALLWLTDLPTDTMLERVVEAIEKDKADNPESPWIPVKERMPEMELKDGRREYSKDVLVKDQSGWVSVIYATRFDCNEIHFDTDIVVVEWMPIPE